MNNKTHFSVQYLIESTSEDEVEKIALKLCLEQSVEMPLNTVPDSAKEYIAQLDSLEKTGSRQWISTLIFSKKLVEDDPTQLLNILYGNSSLKPGIKVHDVDDHAFRGVLNGPAFGIEGIRGMLNAKGRSLSCTALKPVGLTVTDFAERAYKFARGGIDIIKDDHGLTDQPAAPFKDRLIACERAIRKGEQISGKRTLYFPNITTSALKIRDRFDQAVEYGADGVLICPQLTGPEVMHGLARLNQIPIMAHPSFSGAFVIHDNHGFSPELYYGKIWRAFGADAIIYPNTGGRFRFDIHQCKATNKACRHNFSDFKPSFPTPAGGINLNSIHKWVDEYDRDTIYLVGGSLYQHPDGIEKATQEFQAQLNQNEP
ncbi:MAG: RuBisCO large subunit C-terminal-like domain-containing protein [Balneolaceae bacterium]